MKSFDEHTHAFVVRFWLEPRELEGKKPMWRGVVEHVPSGKRLYLEDPEDIISFIISYLPGIKATFRNN